MNELRARVISQEKGIYKISNGTETKAAGICGKYRYEVQTVSDYPGFCPECYGIYESGKDENGNSVKLLRKRKAYIDLAAEHTLSSPDTAFRTVNGAYEKMRRELTEKGIF